jgi:outer membrane lipoprotein-sorting protein
MSYTLVEKGFIFLKTARTALFLLSMTVCLSGCLSARIPPGANYVGSEVASTLSSNVSLSYATPDKSISGSGVLMYKKPDRMRVVLLSPFGSVLQEIYVSGELITIIDSGNGIAFSGSHTDLPEKGDFSGWRYINWLIDIDPPDPSRRTVAVQRINRFGEPEKADFESGLLVSKRTVAGGIVRYGGYSDIQGAQFPSNIRYETAAGETFTITFEEPEVNVTFADDVFTPELSKLRVYPLSVLK